jgi:RNA polymerase sigma-70 factor, ECF subfamily
LRTLGQLDSGVRTGDSSMPDDAEVIALVQRSAARDQAAFAELYDRFLDEVYRYVYYRSGNRSDAEDLTEQVFLQAWAAIDRFRWQGKPFVAWLYSVAHNLLVDRHRRSGPVQSLDAADHRLDLEHPHAARAFSQCIDADLLATAIKQLTPEQQQVIALKFVHGYDTAEIARLMEKREGTIRALQLRALQSLRRHLQREGEGTAA